MIMQGTFKIGQESKMATENHMAIGFGMIKSAQ